MSNVQPFRRGTPSFRHVSQYNCPAEVLNAPLSADEKRAILSSWASDIYTVPSRPDLRSVPGVKSAIALRDILSALRKLDDNGGNPPPRGAPTQRAQRHEQGLDMSISPDVHAARRKALRSNIHRYIRLLAGDLTDFERRFIRRRLEEDRRILATLQASPPAA